MGNSILSDEDILMAPTAFVWMVFALFVALSFAWFSRDWIRTPSKWHIGCMSLSYSLLALLMVRKTEPVDMVVGALAMVLGIFGLVNYWVAKQG